MRFCEEYRFGLEKRLKKLVRQYNTYEDHSKSSIIAEIYHTRKELAIIEKQCK